MEVFCRIAVSAFLQKVHKTLHHASSDYARIIHLLFTVKRRTQQLGMLESVLQLTLQDLIYYDISLAMKI